MCDFARHAPLFEQQGDASIVEGGGKFPVAAAGTQRLDPGYVQYVAGKLRPFVAEKDRLLAAATPACTR